MSDRSARLDRLEARLTAREAAEAARQIAQADSERPPTPGSPAARRQLEAAARAFVAHHQSEQPWPRDPQRNPDREPDLWAAQEAWHDEDDRLIAALAEAVTAL